MSSCSILWEDTQCLGTCSGSRPRYMTPAEVREVLKRMWRNNTDILSMLYAVENKQTPRSSKMHSNYEDVYEMFFIQTVPVAPNKFRAPSKLGDQVFEHPQNTLLVTIINANLDLVTYSNKASTEPVDANQVSLPPLLFPPEAQCQYLHGLDSPQLLYAHSVLLSITASQITCF